MRAPSPRIEPIALAFAIAGGLSAPALGETACAEAVANRVQQRYESVKDLAAEFDQTTQLASLGDSPSGDAEASSGTVTFAKPGRMRWAYSAPEESLVVSDGATLWIYDPSAKEAQRLAAGSGFLSGIAVQFLVGEGNLRRDFQVSARGCGAPEVTLTLVPKRDATYEKIELVVGGETGEVRETRIFDLVGNVTTIHLRHLRTNLAPPPATFTFRPPPGVAVIDLAEPGKP